MLTLTFIIALLALGLAGLCFWRILRIEKFLRTWSLEFSKRVIPELLQDSKNLTTGGLAIVGAFAAALLIHRFFFRKHE